MAITSKDVVYVTFSNEEVKILVDQANNIAMHIVDRPDLHSRDQLERTINVVMGELAEHAVIKWIKDNRKFAQSTIDKTANVPDPGHDIVVKKDNKEMLCSIKSSLSALKGLDEIVTTFKLATKRSELRDINIQVYFWLDVKGSPRTTVPSTTNMAIIGWFSKKDLEKHGFSKYTTEARQAPDVALSEARPMKELLKYID